MADFGHFVLIKSPAEVGRIVADKIRAELKKGRVLWLLSGGSALDVGLAAANYLSDSDAAGLSVSLVDERYGEPGHQDSNWQQLMDGGFNLKNVRLIPYLDGRSAQETERRLSNIFAHEFNEPSYKLAILGMGADGHTAGILQGSPAVAAEELFVGYRGPDYQRLTLGFGGLSRLDEAILYAVGDKKRQQLDRLAGQDAPLSDQPAQIIKRIKNWTVYNDWIGEKI